MGEYRPASDELLASIARGEKDPTDAELGDIAAELLRLRRYQRGENRRAMQIRRLRWAVENMIVKLEGLADSRTGSPVIAVVFQRVAEKLADLHQQVVNLPLDVWGPRSQDDYNGAADDAESERRDG